jgi:class 3 adenylate cyclase
MMRNGECSLQFEDHVEVMKDNEELIPVHAVILGMTKDSASAADSFVIILRDELKLQKQMKQAEEAKSKSEELLFSILPRDIVAKINQGEANISFSIPYVSVVFVDIVNFTQYSVGLAPSQIMEILSTIFAKFDSICEKYDLMTKIKLIGDIYMAAGGIFSPEAEPSQHAQQVVQFGLDCIQAVEEVNESLDNHLQIRVGVNTDGPLIAGIFGTEKPVFDIIGDVINVAARLQSTDIPGSVQISQKTYELISEMNFLFEPRGEIQLKGKGLQKTFLVKPNTLTSNTSFLE